MVSSDLGAQAIPWLTFLKRDNIESNTWTETTEALI